MKLKHFVIMALAFCFVMVPLGKAIGQTGNLDKIDPKLQELMHQSRDASETFRVIIEMTEQYNNPNLERGTAMMTRAQRRDYVVNELKRFSENSQAEVAGFLTEHGDRGRVNVLHRFWIFNGICCEATADCIGELSMRRDVRYITFDVELDLIDTEHSGITRELPPEGVQWHVSKVRADEVWNTMGYTGAGIVVAIIDTGVNYNHVDISNNMWDGGTLYPHHGWDFYNDDNDPMDDNGHGSHVAGIVAGNEVLYKTGVAPGSIIMSLKTMGSNGSGYGESVQCQAVEFALEHGADIINMSLGHKGSGGIALYRTTFENVMNASVVVSASAGNNAYPADTLLKYSPPFNVGAPGNCPPPWHNPDQILQGGASAVICVGNTTNEDLRWRSSSIGPVTWASGPNIGEYSDYPYNLSPPYSLNGLIRPDVSAPGREIWSLDNNSNVLYCKKTGTSQAAPCVAGIIALMLEANPNLTPAQIDMILESTAVPCENQTKKNNNYGAGRVDAFKAVSAVLGYNVTADVMPSGGGTVEGCGTYLGGDVCTLVANPNPGYIFRGWYLPAYQFMPISTSPTIAFPVWNHMHLIAKFMAVIPTTDVYQYYCWFDQDYSTVQTGSFQTTETFFALDASTLDEGLHTLHVMLEDDAFSAPKTYLFLKTPVASPNSTYNYHCWFDQDYGTVQTGSFGGEGYCFALDASALDDGIHTMHVMLEGTDLSSAKTYLFLKAPVASSSSTYNYHCWFDQDYGTVQTGSFGGEGYCFALDASALDDGIHTMHVMLEGTDLSSAKTYLFLKTPVASPNSTYNYHCWFDQDYGTAQTGSFGGEGYCFALDASTLNDGIHTMHVMLEGTDLSSAKTYLFLKAPVASSSSTYNYHCWFDQDYGTVQTGSFGGEGYCFALDASALDDGIHTMHVMLEGTDLSSAKTYLFLKTPVASPNSTYNYHCWFDQDYGTVQSGSFGGEGYCFALDASALDDGIHTMHVMLEGTDLSSTKTYLFLKTPVASPNSTYNYHCWFDQDYGTVYTGTFGGDGYCFALDASALDNGLHFLNVMLEGDELSSAKRYLFYKIPLGGSGISQWEYCINSQWSDAVVTSFVPSIDTLDILTMLPVEPQPISSQCFDFQPNGDQPKVYAKNKITFRFWDTENHFIDRSAMYVDETVHETVEAEWIYRNTTRTIIVPETNHIHWFKLDAEAGDSLAFMSDIQCTMQLFSPTGQEVFSVSGSQSVALYGLRVCENGIYYLAVHDVEGNNENISVTYLFFGNTTQETMLAMGWNWWSTYIEIDGLDGLDMLEESLAGNGMTIKSQSAFVEYGGTIGWSGTLPSINNESGYKIKVTQDCSSLMSGAAALPEDHPITLNPNWNWIGYPVASTQSVTSALSGFEPQSGDIMKGQNGFSTYEAGAGWTPNTFTLVPGKGYMYYSNATTNKTLVFVQSRGEVLPAETEECQWKTNRHVYADNLNMIAVVEVDGVEQREESLELGAFVNGVCRGSAKLYYVASIDRYIAFLTVTGQDNDQIEFRLMDESEATSTSSDHITFSSNAIVGSLDHPFPIHFGKMNGMAEMQTNVSVYPNPVDRNAPFTLAIPETETVAEVLVVNAMGEVVTRETGDLARSTMEGLSTAGVYMLKVTCKSGNVYISRVVVK